MPYGVRARFFCFEVATFHRKLQPGLSLCCFGFCVVQFEQGGFLLAPFAPGFGEGGAHRTRAAPNLVGQRVHFLPGKGLGFVENRQGCPKGDWAHFQLMMSLDRLVPHGEFPSLKQSPLPGPSAFCILVLMLLHSWGSASAGQGRFIRILRFCIIDVCKSKRQMSCWKHLFEIEHCAGLKKDSS